MPSVMIPFATIKKKSNLKNQPNKQKKKKAKKHRNTIHLF